MNDGLEYRAGACTLRVSGGRAHRPNGSPSPPLEERVGERRFMTPLHAGARGRTLRGPVNTSRVLAERNHLLLLPLSSRGGEGTALVTERRDACKEQAGVWHCR